MLVSLKGHSTRGSLACNMPASRLTCAVRVCNNYHYKTREMLDGGYPITYHYFPRRGDLCKRWIEACNRTDNFKTDISFVCSIHFWPEDFIQNKRDDSPNHKSNRRLRYTAFPTRNLTLEEIRSYTVKNTQRKSEEFVKQSNTVQVMIESGTDESEGELPKEEFNESPSTSSDDEFNLLKKKYVELLNDYKALKVNSKTEIERLQLLIKEKDEHFTEKLRAIVSNYLTDTEIDLVMFLRKQKRENL